MVGDLGRDLSELGLHRHMAHQPLKSTSRVIRVNDLAKDTSAY